MSQVGILMVRRSLNIADAVPELVSQRRRWLNGAFFAAVYAQTHFTQIWATDHSLRRKIALHIEFFYQFIMLAFSFFSLVFYKLVK
jgi:chitin synthase